MRLSTSHAEQHATFQLNDIHYLECADAVVQALRAQPHISNVHLDWAHNLVHVTYHRDMIAPEAIEQVIASAGCSCAPANGAGDAAHTLVQPAPARRVTTLGSLPLIVLSRGLREGSEGEDAKWQREQSELLQLSLHSQRPQHPI